MAKYLTFSFDDAVTQDQRLIQLFDKYGMKGTFNLNSGLLGKPGSLIRQDVTVAHVKPRACEIEAIYRGHEVAAHTLTHPMLPTLPDEEVIRQVEEDRLALSDIVGYEVVGMAYPGGGGPLYDERVKKLIRENTGIRYARTTTPAENYDAQEDLYAFRPVSYPYSNWEKAFAMADEFVQMKTDKKQVLYIWGHAYEFDVTKTWEKFEELLQVLAHHDDIIYATNRQALLDGE